MYRDIILKLVGGVVGGGKNTQKVYVQRKVALKVAHSEQPRKHFLHYRTDKSFKTKRNEFMQP